MRRRGFTFIEMMLVIGTIAVLAAILFPVFARAREKARDGSCRANLLNIGMALRIYAHEHDGLYPPHDYDMSPLHPKYLAEELIFQCPSGMIDGEGSLRMVPPPDGEQAAAHPPGLAHYPGHRVWLAQDDGIPGEEPEDDGELRTNYIYHGGGRRHNQMPLAGLVADSEPRHNERANVLMSDGAIISVTESRWRELGFGEELPEYLFSTPPPGSAPPPPAPGSGPPMPSGESVPE